MDNTEPPLIAPAASDAASRSLSDDVRRLVDDGKTLIEAELAYQKSRAVVAGSGLKSIAGWGALALALIFFALMAIVLGLLLVLAPLVGGWAAMAIVVAGVLLAATLSGWVAVRRWNQMAQMLNETDKAA